MNFGRANVTPTIMPRMNANSTAMMTVSICDLLFLCWVCRATIPQGSQPHYTLADYLRVTGTSQPPRAPLERMMRVARLAARWKLPPLPLKLKFAEYLLNFVAMDQVIQQAYARCNC